MSTEKQPLQRIPLNLITGYLGVGKTTTILNLLNRRPEGEKWAILVNEFGHIGIDQEAFELEEGIQVKELTGGCVCCTLAGKLTPTLMRLIHLAQPDRILVEPTGLGHPAGIFDALSSPDLTPFIDLRATLCLMDPRLLETPEVLGSETFQDQINMADVLVLNKTDLAPAELTRDAREHAANLFPPKQQVVEAVQGQVDPKVLDLVREGHFQARFPAYHEHSHHHSSGTDSDELTPEKPIRRLGRAYGRVSCGWIFHSDLVFPEGVFRFLDSLGPADRVKGVFRTPEGWVLYNRVNNEATLYQLAYRRDSRLEIITDQELDWDHIEDGLLTFATTVSSSPHS